MSESRKKPELTEVEFNQLVEKGDYSKLAEANIPSPVFSSWVAKGIIGTKNLTPWFKLISYFQRDYHLISGVIHHVLTMVTPKIEEAFLHFFLKRDDPNVLKVMIKNYMQIPLKLPGKILDPHLRCKLYFYMAEDFRNNFYQGNLKDIYEIFSQDKEIAAIETDEYFLKMQQLFSAKETKDCLAMRGELAEVCNTFMRQFVDSFGQVTYDGFLLSCAQIQSRKKYTFNPTVLEYVYQLKDYLKLLKVTATKRARFAIGCSHWRCGDIIIEDAKVRILILDSMGYDSLIHFRGILEDIYSVFPEAVVYIAENKRQYTFLGCSIFALDDLRHLFTVEDYLPAKYQKNLFKYLEDQKASPHSVSFYSDKDYKTACFNAVKLPLPLERTMASPKLKDEIQQRSIEEKTIALGKRGKTAAQTVDIDFLGKRNLRLQHTLEKLAKFNSEYLRRTDMTKVKKAMAAFAFDPNTLNVAVTVDSKLTAADSKLVEADSKLASAASRVESIDSKSIDSKSIDSKLASTDSKLASTNENPAIAYENFLEDGYTIRSVDDLFSTDNFIVRPLSPNDSANTSDVFSDETRSLDSAPHSNTESGHENEELGVDSKDVGALLVYKAEEGDMDWMAADDLDDLSPKRNLNIPLSIFRSPRYPGSITPELDNPEDDDDGLNPPPSPK